MRSQLRKAAQPLSAVRVVGLVSLLVLGVAAGTEKTAPTASADGADASVTAEAYTPVTEVSTADWRQVSAGADHTCGIRTSGRLYCWGSAGNGQLGDGSGTSQPTPVEVGGGATDWTAVSAGGLHTCAGRSTGRLYCWGFDGNGQLGDGGDTSQPTPVEVAGGATDWTAVTRRRPPHVRPPEHRTALLLGPRPQRPVGRRRRHRRPVGTGQVAGGAIDWTAVSAGGFHTCAGRSTGRLYCWGYDEFGQLGDGGTNTNQRAPVEVAGGPPTGRR